MTPSEFEGWLAAAIVDTALDDQVDVATFAEAGVLTVESGLVVTFADGSALHVTITQTNRKP